MSEERKELLLKDLCARLPYGVKVYRKWIAPLSGSPEEGIFDFCIFDIEILLSPHNWVSTEKGIREVREYDIKPYLFPLSSMTEEQEEELKVILGSTPFFDNKNELFYDMNGCSKIYLSDVQTAINWFNKNHFDYRGLIPMGLAKDATGLNIY